MFKPKQPKTELCVYPACEVPILGGAILVHEDGSRVPLCKKHMGTFFESVLIGVAQAMAQQRVTDE